jgi:serine protease Do
MDAYVHWQQAPRSTGPRAGLGSSLTGRTKRNGTGVLFDPNGYIITNNQVIDKASTMEIMLTLKRMFKAKLVGADSDLDIAAIKIDAKNLPVVPLGIHRHCKSARRSWPLAIPSD